MLGVVFISNHLVIFLEICVHRLFHVVVDSDRTAAQILSIMNKQKMAGEVTFLPLNKLQPPNPTYPQAKVISRYTYGMHVTIT